VLGDVDDSERAAVRDLLVPLMMILFAGDYSFDTLVKRVSIACRLPCRTRKSQLSTEAHLSVVAPRGQRSHPIVVIRLLPLAPSHLSLTCGASRSSYDLRTQYYGDPRSLQGTSRLQIHWRYRWLQHAMRSLLHAYLHSRSWLLVSIKSNVPRA